MRRTKRRALYHAIGGKAHIYFPLQNIKPQVLFHYAYLSKVSTEMFFSCITVYIWLAVGRTAEPFHAQTNSLYNGHTLKQRFLKQLFHKTFVYVRPEKSHTTALSPQVNHSSMISDYVVGYQCVRVHYTAFKTTWGARYVGDSFKLQDLMVPFGFHL